MKRLLTLLGTITLSSTTGLAVVSCGSKQEPEVEKTVETVSSTSSLDTINDFKEELSKVSTSVFALPENQSKLIRSVSSKTDSEDYKLFNLNYLQENFELEQEEAQKSWDLNEIQGSQQMAIYDLNKIFTQLQFENKLEKAFETGDNATTYRKIYMGSGLATLGNFKVLSNNIFSLTSQIIEGETIYSIQMTVAKEMFYRDEEGNKSVFTTNGIPLKLIIANDGAIIKLIKRSSEEIPDTLYAGINDISTKFKFSDIKKINNNFKNYGKLENQIADYINSGAFETKFAQVIKDTIGKTYPVEVSFSGPLTSTDQVTTYGSLFGNNNYKQVKYLSNFKGNALVNSLVMKHENTETMDKKVGVQELRKNIAYYDKNFQDFNTSLKAFLQDKDLRKSEMEDVIKKTYSYGNIRVSNINVIFANGAGLKSSLPIPTIVIPWTYENDGGDIKFNQKDEAYLSAIFDSLVVLNKYMLRINEDANTRLKTMFTISDELTNDYRNTFGKYSWNEVLSLLDQSSEHQIQLSKFKDESQPTQFFVSGEQVKKALSKEEGFKFEGFSSWIDLWGAEHLAIKKTSDGRIGIGLFTGSSGYFSYFDKKFTLQDIGMEYKLNLGLTRIQEVMPWQHRTDDVNTGADITAYIKDRNFYGNNLSEEEYFAQAFADKSEWLLFELDKK